MSKRDSSPLKKKLSTRKDEYNTFELIIFDLDDTLIANREATLMARTAALQTLFGNNLRSQKRSILLKKWQRSGWFFGPEERHMVLTILAKEKEELSKQIKKRIKKAEHNFETVFISNIKPIDGTFKILSELSKSGLQIGLISNGISKIQQRKLKKTGLNKYFSTHNTIIIPESSPIAKPHPFPILKMCQTLSVSPEKTLVVGDRGSDVVSANLAGCWSILFHRRNLQVKKPNSSQNILRVEIPDYSIQTWNQLRNIVMTHNGNEK